MSIRANIILVEDDREHRQTLTKCLKKKPYDHRVIPFRDLTTLRKADRANSFAKQFEPTWPLLVILDIMLAEKLKEDAEFAPRFAGENPSPEQSRCHVDDDLGLRIADDIRLGTEFSNIPHNVPILFLTARSNHRVKEEIRKLGDRGGPTEWLGKPAFVTDVQEAIQRLLERSSSATSNADPHGKT